MKQFFTYRFTFVLFTIALLAAAFNSQAHPLKTTPSGPTVSSIALTGSSNSNGSTETFIVTFSEDVTGVDAGDFTPTTTGSVSTGSLQVVPSSASVYSVTVQNIQGDGTLRLDLNSSGTGITDLSANPIISGFTSGQTLNVDHTPPTATAIYAASPASPTNTGALQFIVTFSENVSGVSTDAFTLVTTGSAAASFSGSVLGSGKNYIIQVSASGTGTVGLNLNGSGTGITDPAGNEVNTGYTGQTFTIDQTPPTVLSITANSPSNTYPLSNTDLFTHQLTYNVTFSEDVTGVDASSFTVTTTGTVTYSTVSVQGFGSSYQVQINGVTGGDGTVRLDLNGSGSAIADNAGNPISGGFTSGDVFTIDNTGPTVSSIVASSPSVANPTNAASVTYTVTFSEPVHLVAPENFYVAATGVTASGVSVNQVSTSVYQVTINGISGTGTVGLDVNGNAFIEDFAGNLYSGGVVVSNDLYTIDQTPPAINNITFTSDGLLAPGTAVSQDNVTLSFTTNKPVLTPVVSIEDNQVNVTSTGANSYTISYPLSMFDSPDAFGNVAYTIALTDAAGNTSNFNDGNAGGAKLVFSITPAIFETGTLAALNTSTGQASGSESFTVSGVNIFEDDDGGALFFYAPAGFELSTDNAGFSDDISIDQTQNTHGIGTINPTTVYVRLKNSATAGSFSGNIMINNDRGASKTVPVSGIVHASPSVLSISAATPSVSPTNAGSVTYTVTFSDAVAGVDAGDFAVTTSGVSTGGVGSVTTTDNIHYAVTINSISGNGVLRLDLNSSADITGYGGRAISGGFTTGDVYTIDNIPPTVQSITANTPPNTGTINTATVSYTVSFVEPVTGVDASDFTTTATGSITRGSISVSPVSGSVYNVTVNDIGGSGTLRLDLSSGTNVQDRAGNIITGGFTAGDVYAIDDTPPTVISITATTPANSTPTSAPSVTYTVTFSEDVTGVNAGNFTVSLNSNATAGSVSVMQVSGSVYKVTVSSTGGTGTLQLQLNNVNGIADPAGNALSAAFINGDSYVIDNTPPLLTSGSYFTNNGYSSQYGKAGDQVNLFVGFSEPIGNFTMTIGGHPITVTSSNNNMNWSGVYTITPSDPDGPMVFDMHISDLAGNSIEATSEQYGAYVYVENSPPVATISAPSATVAGNNGSFSVNYNVTYTAPYFNFSTLNASGITLNTTGTATGDVSVSADNTGRVFTVTISNITGLGTLGISVAGGYAQDIPGNIDMAGAGPSATFSVVPSDATLSGLAVSSGTLSPRFNSATNSYSVSVNNSVQSIIVTPLTTDSHATVTVNGNPATTPVSVPEGVTTNIDVVVTAQDGTTTQTYTIAVSRLASGNATLSAMGPSKSPLNPVFTPGTTTYSITLPNATASLTVTPVTADANATMTVNGSALASGSTSAPLALNEGASGIITIVVTAQNGATQTYTINVTRAQSSNATLTGIGQSTGTLSPAFTAGTTAYSISLPNSKTDITVTPVTADAYAAMTVNGTSLASGSTSASVALTEGSTSTISIQVTAQDGTVKTYTVAVSRAASSNATLTAMGPSTGPLSPAFAPGITSYTLNVPNSKATFSVTPVTANANATMTVNGTALTSGSTSAPVALTEGGTNTISIQVTAQDGTFKTYTVAVSRASSSDASLSAVGPSSGPLSPAFAPGTTSYTLNLPNSKATFTVTPVTTNANATMTVNGTALASGSTSAPVTLAEGSTGNVSIQVTAQDGTVKTYTIAVSRAASSNATLAAIGPGNGPLSPVFAPGTTSYTLAVPNSVSTFTVTPVTADANATMTVNGVNLASGSQSAPVSLTAGTTATTTIVVTAQDGTVKTYTIAVTRAKSGNANLAAMGPQYGPLSPVFNAATTSYTLTVPYSKTTITVAPVAADANATIKVNGADLGSGSTSAPAALTAGSSTAINVQVTAQDGTVKTYTVQVTRLLSNDAGLAAMGPQYGPLSPVFTTGTTSYTVNVANSKSTFTVAPVTHDPNATITVNGTALASGVTSAPVALAAGATTNINIVVTAQDGTTTKTYTIAVNRAPGSSDSYQDISVSKPAETVTIAEDGIKVHQGISPNGDGIDDVLQIDNISQYPDNHLKIMNRNGELVYEAKGYDNTSKAFDGHSSKNSKMQLPGTYFFQLDYTVNGIVKHKTGYLVLKY